GGLFVRTDVSVPADLEAAVSATLTKHGRLDFVHLNAGVVTGESDVERLSVEAYRRAVGVNVDGVVFGAMAAVPAMKEGGAIVATASLAGLVAYPGDPVYGLTKHAVIGFVRALADQLEPKRITVNAVCPGFADTPMLAAFVNDFRKAGFPLLVPDQVAESVLQIAASGRTGEVFVCQPGRTCEPYRFRGVPGPRTDGAEGMEPPMRPGE
ncbi:MAG: SDR family NAD(P)-dependent oxidoreductase, partial [Actinomycetota bacterium]